MIRAAVVASTLFAATPARADNVARWDGVTIAEQAGTGLVAGGLFGAVGGLVGGGLGAAAGGKGNWGAPLAGAALGILVAGTTGLVWGVDYSGDQAGQNGEVGTTLVGAIAGLGASVGFEVIVSKQHWKLPFPVHVVVVGTFMLTGPIVGYQLGVTDTSSKRMVPILATVF